MLFVYIWVCVCFLEVGMSLEIFMIKIYFMGVFIFKYLKELY